MAEASSAANLAIRRTLAAPILERGATFVGYRLIPDLRPPDTCEDVELGLGWLAKHSYELKVDTERVCIAGASAEAVLAAMVALRHWPAECRLAPDLIKGLVVISGGMYDFGKILEAAPQFCNPDSERWFADLAMSIQRVPAHTVIVRGEYDLPVVHPDSEALARAVRAHGGFVDEFVEPGADHYAAVHGFATPGTAVSERVAKILGLTAA
jgi:arylformamidase